MNKGYVVNALKQSAQCYKQSKTPETPCNDNWLLLLISFTNIYVIYIYIIYETFFK